MILKTLLLAFILLWNNIPSLQAATPREAPPPVTLRLVTEAQTLENGQKEVFLGLEATLAPGWHTYWKNPGQAGAAPEVNLDKSINVAESNLLFPAPHRFETPLFDTIGYENHVLFPIKAIRHDLAKPMDIKANVTLYLCNQICVPHHEELSLYLPTGPHRQSPDALSIQRALALVPTATEEHGLSFVQSERLESKLKLTVSSKQPFTAPDLFIETSDDVFFSKPVFVFSENRKKADITLTLEGTLPTDKSMADIRLTPHLVDGTRMLAETLPNLDTKTPRSAPWLILILALLGGFILNLMPCVLPVLSLKILSVIKHDTKDTQKIRRSFLTTGAGIILSFLALAVMTIGLKYAGFLVGWGIQFQQPLFLVFMITLLTLFATNLWGFWSLSLPAWLVNALSTRHYSGLAGDFSTGFLATLLATPCTAPFLGTAISFALMAGAKEIAAVFFMMGLGMALPYFLIAAKPRLARYLPKPGKWMTLLTALLGTGLAATALWLLFILQTQTGTFTASIVGMGGAVLVFFLYLHLRYRGLLRKLALFMASLVIASMFLTAGAATILKPQPVSSLHWEVFEEEKMIQAVENGQLVFVDITADWCLNCKFNKRFILSQQSVTERLYGNEEILLMQGDWTTTNPILTEFMQRHGRYGIPFNAVFGPKAPNGILLPELLTPSSIFKALDHAR